MPTPNTDISNLLTAVAAGNTQQPQITAPGETTNSGFTSLFEGFRNLLQTETTNLVVGAEQPGELPIAQLQGVSELEVTADGELAVFATPSQPPIETGKPLPVSGEILPEPGLQLPVMIAGTEAGAEKPATEPKTHTLMQTHQAVVSQLTIPPAPAVQITQTSQAAPTAQAVQTAEAKQTAQLSQVAHATLPLAQTDLSPVVASQTIGQPGQATTETPVVVLPAGFQSDEVTRKASLKSVADSTSAQPVLENGTPDRKPVLPEQLNLQYGKRIEMQTEHVPVVETTEITHRAAEKTADSQLAATTVSRPPATDRLPVVDNVQPLQIDSRVPETMLTTARPAAVLTAQNTVILPETIALRQPGWNQNLGNNILWMVKEDLQSASIRVKPAELGTLNIQISVQQDQLQVNISAHQGAAREALEAALPRLREQFAAQGFQQVNVDISQQQERGTADQRNSSDTTRSHDDWPTTETENQTNQEHSPGLQSQTYRVHNGLLDAFA